MDQFKYVDESSIDDCLKCDICKKPFTDPVLLPCKKTYCMACINEHTSQCPRCDQYTSNRKDLDVGNPIIQQLLDKRLVRCLLCSEDTDIQRKDFPKHAKELCLKRIVSCSANDIQCSWSGPFDQFEEHVNECSYEKLRSLLTELLNDRKDLQELKLHSNGLKNNFEVQQKQIEQIQNENQTLKQEIERLKQIENEFNLLTEKSKEQLTQIETLTNENQEIERLKQIENEFNVLTDKSKEQSTQIETLTNANQEIERFKQIENEFNVLTDKSKEQLTEIETLTNENQDLTKKLNEQKVTIDELTTETNRLKEIENVYQRLLEQVKEIDPLKTLCQSLCQLLQVKEDDLNRLQINYQLLQGYTHDLSEQNRQLMEENNHLSNVKEENQSLKQQIEQFEREISHLGKQIDDLQIIESSYLTLRRKNMADEIKLEQLAIELKRFETKSSVVTDQLFECKEAYENIKLKEIIDQCQTDSLINLNGEKLNDNDMEIVIKTGIINKGCQSLILSANNLSLNSIKKLSLHLTFNQTLTKLILTNNQLSELAVRSLAECLAFQNKTLKVLNLSSNQLNDQSLVYLSEMLKSNQTILSIGLHENQISDQSIEYFSKVIQSFNETLEEISLYSNKLITDASIQSIIGMITNNASLKILWIWDCQLSEQGKQQIQQAIQTKDLFDLQI